MKTSEAVWITLISIAVVILAMLVIANVSFDFPSSFNYVANNQTEKSESSKDFSIDSKNDSQDQSKSDSEPKTSSQREQLSISYGG